MKTAISLPNDLFAAAESLARRLGMSRSGLYASALEEFIVRHRARKVSERLDAVYGPDAGGLDPSIAAAQGRVVRRSDW